MRGPKLLGRGVWDFGLGFRVLVKEADLKRFPMGLQKGLRDRSSYHTWESINYWISCCGNFDEDSIAEPTSHSTFGCCGVSA